MLVSALICRLFVTRGFCATGATLELRQRDREHWAALGGEAGDPLEVGDALEGAVQALFDVGRGIVQPE